ncbi:hypothetical protein GUITHDRAFT_112370 [Guillardia theta CCMP2712]|uniref:Uncharacterized protein n=1 Tax=Guillardia theta (strain CCMP2712) TaxID=905079 RepID=L1IZG1_GUITC|nr:hypothetical protein GUITHDRAFT_112370 [Guillardia theta CCMP2712]EKX41663.1 hypothetical protein GUITHDRAFT_112370 [Guillardia theta CCMP2712]|eukprot:XP_005828643.1 hypothetical protein GUITHDRAFT_112370 [Guillardia theta CCMP2712]
MPEFIRATSATNDDADDYEDAADFLRFPFFCCGRDKDNKHLKIRSSKLSYLPQQTLYSHQSAEPRYTAQETAGESQYAGILEQPRSEQKRMRLDYAQALQTCKEKRPLFAEMGSYNREIRRLTEEIKQIEAMQLMCGKSRTNVEREIRKQNLQQQAMMDIDKMLSGKSSSLADMGEINKECYMTVRDIKQKLVLLTVSASSLGLA